MDKAIITILCAVIIVLITAIYGTTRENSIDTRKDELITALENKADAFERLNNALRAENAQQKKLIDFYQTHIDVTIGQPLTLENGGQSPVKSK